MEIRGQLDRITYANEENGYTIAKLKVQGRAGAVTVVGNLFAVQPGEELRLSGEWKVHPRYGEQFHVSSCETVIPATAKGIERYLGSGMIKGLGPVMAQRVVERFGTRTLEVIEGDIERLGEVEGIGEKRIEMIRTAWRDQKEIRDVMIFLQGHGVSPAYAVKIFKHYGRGAVEVVRRTPYRLAEDIFGIGFVIADRIAEKLGMPRDSDERIAAGIVFTLLRLADEGHVCYPLDLLVERAAAILKVDAPSIPHVLQGLAEAKKIVIEEWKMPNLWQADVDPDGSRPLKAAYLTHLHVAETGIALRLGEILHVDPKPAALDLGALVRQAQGSLGIALTDQQRGAVGASATSRALIVTGGPGTGKTTIIKSIIALHRLMGRSVLLAAPTGRAAKRMTEATGQEAKTIHRLLEYSPASGAFKRSEENRLEADLIIVDEVSMVDAWLMHQFLKAVPDRASLILVGDADQLPSVGPGSILRDIIDSERVPVVRLTEIFRQSKESMIIVNAHRVNRGEMPVARPEEGQERDFFFISLDDQEKVLRKVVDLCVSGIPGRFGLDPLKDVQVIAPMHKGPVGVANLNVELQKALNPEREELQRGSIAFRRRDKVMQLKNNYEKEVFNGDIGRISEIDRETQTLVVDYDGRQVRYDFSELDEIALAYAVSVHKSQGSEYPAVVMPIVTQHYLLLQRNLLYTALTRGKKIVYLVGTGKAIAIAVNTRKTVLRFTMLRERLFCR